MRHERISSRRGLKIRDTIRYKPGLGAYGLEDDLRDGRVPGIILRFYKSGQVKVELLTKRGPENHIVRIESLERELVRPAPTAPACEQAAFDAHMTNIYQIKDLKDIEPDDKLVKKTVPIQGTSVLSSRVRVVQYEVYQRPRTGDFFRVMRQLA